MGAFTLVATDTVRGVNVGRTSRRHGTTVTGVLCPDCVRVGIADACGQPVLDPMRGTVESCGRYQ